MVSSLGIYANQNVWNENIDRTHEIPSSSGKRGKNQKEECQVVREQVKKTELNKNHLQACPQR